MQSDEVIVGVDVSKETLACSVNGRHLMLANDRAAIEQWLAGLTAGSVVALEATGRYGQMLACMAHAAGMRVFVLNAKDVYFYAKGLGCRGKTDPGDAAVIERYVREHRAHLHPWEPGSQAQQQLQELVRRRQGITGHRASLRQMLAADALLRDPFKILDEQFEALLATLDREIQSLIDADADMKEASAVLQTITGIKLVGSAMLIGLLSRIAFANVDALIAYSGLDPRPNDSGKRRGKRVLSKKGPPELRRQMYLAAFSAVRSKAFRPTYEALLARGFKTTEAFVILARKLLRIAWAVWNTRKPFNPLLVNPNLA
jgi:transposase